MDNLKECLTHSRNIPTWQEFEVAFINNVVWHLVSAKNIMQLCQIQVQCTPEPRFPIQPSGLIVIRQVCIVQDLNVIYAFFIHATKKLTYSQYNGNMPAIADWISRLFCKQPKQNKMAVCIHGGTHFRNRFCIHIWPPCLFTTRANLRL